ncbi:ankyrin [Thozetella sp. PMI_491]|nr:ankyrin [Thozetella sp. PMI_491]
MASLAALPTELVVFVIDNFDSLRDLATVARLDRRFHGIVNPLLYKLAVERDAPWPLAWAAHSGVTGTLSKLLRAGVDPNHTFFDSRSKEAWRKATTDPKPYWIDKEDLAGWSSDRGSESDHNIDWSPETTDSDRAGTSHHPSDSSRSGQYIDSYQSSRSERRSERRSEHKSEYRSEFRTEYSDDEMMDDFDDGDDASMISHVGAVGAEDIGLGPRAADDDEPAPLRRFSALHLAARRGHTETVDLLLRHGASINAVSEYFCDCGRMYGVLNAAECPEYEPTPPSWSPLHVAICNSHGETAKLLLSRGSSYMMDVSGNLSGASPARYDATALHHAAGHGLVDVVQYLVTEGIQPDVEIVDEKTLSPIYYAYANRRWDSTLPFLLSLGANLDVDIKMFLPYSTITPLGECCKLGAWDIADRLLEIGADATRGFIATGSGRGLSPLHMCCLPSAQPVGKSFEPRIFEEEDRGARRAKTIGNLIARGADLNSVDCAGDTAMVHAGQNHAVAGLAVLLAAGADVHLRNGVGRTALMQAIVGPPNHNPASIDVYRFDEGLSQILKLLIQAGARVDDVDTDGNNVLHLIFYANYANTSEQVRRDLQLCMLRQLLSKPGVQRLLHARNTANCTPLQLAFQARNYEACDIMLRRGAAPGIIAPQDLFDMFQFALADADEVTRNRGMNLVLDLDIEQALTSDPALFARLLTESGRSGVVTASVLAARGLLYRGVYDYTNLLCRAIEMGDFVLAYSLLEAGANVNATNPDGYTPLVLFLIRDSEESTSDLSRVSRQFLQALLERGANIHLERPHVRPLTKAIVEGWAAIVSAMLKKNPLREDPGAVGGCYLHDAVAIIRGVRRVPSEKIIGDLIDSGASLTELNNDGDTPLSVLLRSLCNERAFTWRYHRFIKPLCGPGVDINRKNNVGISAAEYLHQLLNPATSDAYQADFLARHIQLVDIGGGLKDIRFSAVSPVQPQEGTT